MIALGFYLQVVRWLEQMDMEDKKALGRMIDRFRTWTLVSCLRTSIKQAPEQRL